MVFSSKLLTHGQMLGQFGILYLEFGEEKIKDGRNIISVHFSQRLLFLIVVSRDVLAFPHGICEVNLLF